MRDAHPGRVERPPAINVTSNPGSPAARATRSAPTWARNRRPAKRVQDRLGHSTVTITLNVYSHVTPQLLTEAADKVAALIIGEGN